MEIVQIEKRSLVGEVHAQMQEIILSGTWREGEKIASEHQLALRFNVSRVVVREALQRLRAEKLIVTRHGLGSFVSNPKNFEEGECGGNAPIALTEQDFLEVMELRRCLEFRAIELSARCATVEDLENIQAALERMERAVGDVEEFTLADYAFHYTVIASAHNRMFLQAMDSCREQVIGCLREMNKLNDSRTWGMELHREQVELLCRRDVRGAMRVLKKSRDYNLARLAQYFQSDRTQDRQ